jgi:hypothetical protein
MLQSYIYMLIDPRYDDEKDTIKYIGKTEDYPPNRLKQHISESKRTPDQTTKTKWINELLQLGLKPRIEIIEVTDNILWEERETYWIKYYRDNGYKITNTADGGGGVVITSKKMKKESDLARLQRRKEKLQKDFEQGNAKSRWLGVHKNKNSELFYVSTSSGPGGNRVSNNFFKYETEAALHYNYYVLFKYGENAVLNHVTQEDVIIEKQNRIILEEKKCEDILKNINDIETILEKLITDGNNKRKEKEEKKLAAKLEKERIREEKKKIKLEGLSNNG